MPIIHPLECIKDLFLWRRPYKLYDSVCEKCGQAMKTIYDPAKNLRVYCEGCYNNEII